MTKLRLDQLPPKLREQVLGKLDENDPARRPKRSRAGDSRNATDGWCQCGEHFTSVSAWERHSSEHGRGHRRFELIQPPAVAPATIPEPDTTATEGTTAP